VLAALAWRPPAERMPADFRGAPRQNLLSLFGAFALCALPWWIHHARVVGSPFFNLTSYTLIGFWGHRPDNQVLQDFALTPARWPQVLGAELPHMAGKWIVFFPHAVKNALTAPSGGTGWLAPVGAAVAFARASTFPDTPSYGRRFVLCATALALIPVASQTLTSHQRLYLEPFLPIYAWFAAIGAHALMRRLPGWAHRPRAMLGALALLILPSALPALRGAAEESHTLAERVALERQALVAALPGMPGETVRAAHLPERGNLPRVVFSDTPDFVAWTTGLPTLWVTRTQFQTLYPGDASGEAATFGLPPREQAAGFFHDDFRDPSTVGTFVRP